jgi:apolipoprotein N-acyltransferase
MCDEYIMSLYLFFLGVFIFCVLQFAYSNLICLFVFLVPLFWVPLIVDKSVLKYRYIFLAIFLFWLVSIFWISSPHPAAIIGLVVLSFFLSFYWLLFFISARAAVQLQRIPVMVAMPICWVGCEFLRNHLLGGFSFCSIEHLLFSFPVLIQIADIGGSYFVGGMIMAVGAGMGTILFATLLPKFCPNIMSINSEININVTKNMPPDKENKSQEHKSSNKQQKSLVVSSLTEMKNRRRIFVTIIFTILLITVTFFYGYLTIALERNLFSGEKVSDSGGGSRLKIASLQGNSPVFVTMTQQQLSECLRQYIELTRAAASEVKDLDLIIWSETVCPIPYILFQDGATYESSGLNRKELERYRSMLLDLSIEVGVPILYGLSTIMIDNNHNFKLAAEPLRLNSALLVVPDPPAFNSRYDKIQLVMFGEYVPFADYLPANFPLRSICQEAGRGDKPVAMPLGKGCYASVNICFESTVPQHIRGQILSLKKQGREPTLLINISNNGWFKFTNQIDQHLATQVFRAVENRRMYVSSANCGYSAMINCYGKITKIGKREVAEPVIEQITIKYWTPIYHYIGDIPALICTILTILFTLKAAYKKKKLK